MFCFKKLLAIAIGLCVVQTVSAQHHYNAWFRSTVTLHMSKHISIDNELQHRRQNGLVNSNLFDRNLMFAFRNWIHYKHNKRLTLSLSPFAYFNNYRIVQKQPDEGAAPISEIRFSGALMFHEQLFSKLMLTTRTALEYRIPDQSRNIVRMRERLGVGYAFSSKATLNIFDEILVNLAGTSFDHFFDHNRMALALEYKPTIKIIVTFGYMYISRLPPSNTYSLQEHNMFLNLTYELGRK